jgi:hypothetical protein
MGGMTYRRFGLAVLTSLLVLVGCMFCGASAFALNGRAGAGSFSAPSTPTGVAIDQETGNVYVVESGAGVIAAFGPEGGAPSGVAALTPAFTATQEPIGVAIDNACWYHQPRLTGAACEAFDPSNGDLYVANPKGNAIEKLALNKLTEEYETVSAFPFHEPNGVAVDHEGNVYVADYFETSIPVFNTAGVEIGKIETQASEHPAIVHPGFVAVGSPGVVYVSNYEGPTVQLTVNSKYEVQSEKLLQASGKAVALDASGNVLVDGQSSVSEYSSSGAMIGIFGEREPGVLSLGLAVDTTTGKAYVSLAGEATVDVYGPTFKRPSVSTGSPSELRATSATLNGTVNPEGLPVTSCVFEYGTSASYGQTVPCEPNPGSGEAPVPVSAKLTGLQADTAYHYRLKAAYGNGAIFGADEEFTTAGPKLSLEAVSDVTADSVTLEATINPHNAPTSYYFQYGTSTGYGTDIPGYPGSSIGSGEGNVEVSQHGQNLDAGTVYHYRVVQLSELEPGKSEEFDGPDQTFTTQPSGIGSVLPDNRIWEQVSPQNKHGALLGALNANSVIQTSASGDAITYTGTASTESLPPGNSGGTQMFSARGAEGASAWGSRDISTSREVANGLKLIPGEEYSFFSTDLSSGVVDPFGAFSPSLSAEASERTPYLRSDYSSDSPDELCVASCYRPLVTGAPGFANVPEGTKFGKEGTEGDGKVSPFGGPLFLGASLDGSHLVLSSKVALTKDAAPTGGLYEWAGGQLQLISVLPGGEPALAPAGVSFPELGSEGGKTDEYVRRNAISADGSRVIWSTGSTGPGGGSQLYIRDVPRKETLQLGSSTKARFQTASSDGSRVFFTEAGDLYEFDAPLSGALSAGQAMDLIPGAEVQGMVSASEDGTSIYFVADGVLTGAETNEHGEKAVAGQPNLYLYRAGVTRLVAVLSGEDSPDWGERGLQVLTTTRVSPNGDWFEFMSERSLTGYDTRDASSGALDEEVFLYDAGVGRLACASCNPTGARPHGALILDIVTTDQLVDKQGTWGAFGGRWLAANVPAWTSPLYQSRYLSDSGRLFFNSSDALVPADTNSVEDVYEYEPPGVGDCTNEISTFSPRSDGCVGLISSGTSKEESAFLDASENGDDVFFLTTAQLSSQDTDTVRDVYDARVDGGFPVPQPPPACEGDACQSPVAAPNDPTPGSLTYQGPGNPTPAATVKKAAKKKVTKCAKGKRLSHGKCTKIKSKKKVRKPGNKRRAKS